jgi:uncharacterized protein YjdB
LLTPGNWDIVWKIPQRSDGKDRFFDLITAQKAVGGSASTLEYQSLKTIVRKGSGVVTPASSPSITGNLITQNISEYTTTLLDTGSANFNLEYVPFGAKAIWGELVKPVWIIRNGVNDKAQDGNTTFVTPENSSSPWNATKNGNGAVAFTIYGITGITLNKTTLTLQITKSESNPTETLTATIEPSDATDDKTVTWSITSSSPTGVATVSTSGVVTGIKAGTATIKAVTFNGKEATCTVTVTDARWQAGGSGRFVAVANGKAAWSVDGGQTWEEVALPSGEPGAIAYGNGRFIATIGSDKVIISSDGGETWVAKSWNSYSVTKRAWDMLVYKSGGTFVGIARDYSYATLITTDNGETWTESINALSTPSDTTATYSGLAYGGGKFLAVTNDGQVARSSVGSSSWSMVGQLKFPITYERAIGGYIGYGDYNGGRFVAIDLVTKGASWSTDGTTWNPVTRPEANVGRGSGPFYGNGTFVVLPPRYAQNAGWDVFYSTTGGESWKTASMPFQANWTHAAYGGGLFVAINGDSNKIATSTNGKNWVTGGSLPSSVGLTRIIYGKP